MSATLTQSARIIGPLSYRAAGGQMLSIPLGPCLVERGADQSINIIWGDSGQSSAALPVDEVKAARDAGRLVLLD